MLTYVVLPKDQAVEAGVLVQQAVDSILAIGLPLEYILVIYAKGQGLPDSAAKHLLWLDNEE